MMTFTPAGDAILITEIAPDEKTASGLIIPDSSQSRVTKGTVRAVGPGLKNDDGKFILCDVSIGDTVLYDKASGMNINIEGGKYKLLRERDILGTFSEA